VFSVPVQADEARGRALYENHCGECHSARVHDRAQRLPTNLAELRAQVDRWQKELKLRWSDEDIADVVGFLNATKYKF
jgi:mono/diheme cytochrome c family protein